MAEATTATRAANRRDRIDIGLWLDDVDNAMDAPHTIRTLLAATTPWLQKKGSPSARLDAELLFGHALQMSRLDLYLDLDRPLSATELDACRELVRRRGTGEPVAYLTGAREFWRLRIRVTPAVLIPRPETELLVEQALALLPEDAEGVVVDACTGSGCVGLALLSEREGIRVIATDVSDDALAIARDNASTTGFEDRFEARRGDLLGPILERDVLLIVANPPYVKRGAAGLQADVAAFEPSLALYGLDDDALGHHRRIVEQADAIVGPGGAVLLEIGHDQGDGARALATSGFPLVDVVKDLDGHDRVVRLRRSGAA